MLLHHFFQKESAAAVVPPIEFNPALIRQITLFLPVCIWIVWHEAGTAGLRKADVQIKIREDRPAVVVLEDLAGPPGAP